MNERTQRLRNRFLASPREIDVERAQIITASYKENEDKPAAQDEKKPAAEKKVEKK